MRRRGDPHQAEVTVIRRIDRDRERETQAPTIAADIPRPRGEVLRVERTTFNGRTFVQVRCFYTGSGGELLPGRAGVTIRDNELESVAAALTELARKGAA